ncbi:MAG: ExbD/TolR family protein [Pseudomonadota bacterium]
MISGPAPQEGGRSRRRVSRRSPPMSEINVTPFVDVMLVLLIIFMVAAPLLTVGVPVNLPETAASPLPQEDEQPLELTLTADGRMLLMETEIVDQELLPRMRAIAAERSDRKIYLRADGALAYDRVMQVLGALNAGGFREIGFITDAGGPSFDGSTETGGSDG